MSNLHRIQWIDDQIRREKYPNCSDIARRFEISRRQASRDIEYLRYSLGAPIEFDPARQGYYYESAFSIPRETLRESDITLLSRLADSYGRLGTTRAAEIAELFRRIHGPAETIASTGTSPVTPDEAASMDATLISVRSQMESALRERMDLEIEYLDSGNTRTRRCIMPLRLFQWGGNELVEAYCRLRGATRQFRLDRIRSAELVPRTDMPPVSHDSGSEIVRVEDAPSPGFGMEPFRATIRTGNYLESTCVYEFYSSAGLFAHLIAHAPRFEIVTPKWLREKAARTFSRLADLHA